MGVPKVMSYPQEFCEWSNKSGLHFSHVRENTDWILFGYNWKDNEKKLNNVSDSLTRPPVT